MLAQAVFAGETKGYTKHPQLERFRENFKEDCLIEAIGVYLWGIYHESVKRGYSFNMSKIRYTKLVSSWQQLMTVTHGQILYERDLLLSKLKKRNSVGRVVLPGDWVVSTLSRILVHPMFLAVTGPIESWEKIKHDKV